MKKSRAASTHIESELGPAAAAVAVQRRLSIATMLNSTTSRSVSTRGSSTRAAGPVSTLVCGRATKCHHEDVSHRAKLDCRPEEREGAEKVVAPSNARGPEPNVLDVICQVVPFWIHPLDQLQALSPTPALDLLLSSNRSEHIMRGFTVDQPERLMPGGVAVWIQSASMLRYPLVYVVRHPDVQLT